jgi:uncharacterized damage-inducible protein DinB
MTTQAEQLAAAFERANNDLIATVGACPDEQWHKRYTEEGWSIGVVAHHVTAVYPAFAGIVKKLASGEDMPPRSSIFGMSLEGHRGRSCNHFSV